MSVHWVLINTSKIKFKLDVNFVSIYIFVCTIICSLVGCLSIISIISVINTIIEVMMIIMIHMMKIIMYDF